MSFFSASSARGWGSRRPELLELAVVFLPPSVLGFFGLLPLVSLAAGDLRLGREGAIVAKLEAQIRREIARLF